MEVNVPMDIKPDELRCPSCFGRDIVHSHQRGWRDRLMARLGREPQHCRFCGRRFYILKKKEQAEL